MGKLDHGSGSSSRSPHLSIFNDVELEHSTSSEMLMSSAPRKQPAGLIDSMYVSIFETMLTTDSSHLVTIALFQYSESVPVMHILSSDSLTQSTGKQRSCLQPSICCLGCLQTDAAQLRMIIIQPLPLSTRLVFVTSPLGVYHSLLFAS